MYHQGRGIRPLHGRSRYRSGARLNKIGMNHICFRVDDIEAEVANIRAAGFRTRNEIMDFHSRKLVFLDRPEGVTVELSQWH